MVLIDGQFPGPQLDLVTNENVVLVGGVDVEKHVQGLEIVEDRA